MGKDWHMTSNQYSWLVTIYYLGYIFFQWLILAWRVVRLPVRILLPSRPTQLSSADSSLTVLHDRYGSPAWP